MTNTNAAKTAHQGEQNKNIYGGNLVKLQLALDVSKDGKNFESKWVPLKDVYVKSGLQEKSDGYLYGLAEASHRGYTKAAWNMCCKNRKKYRIWGSDADVERKLEGAQLLECMFTKSTRDNNKVVKDDNKGRKDNKPQGQENVSKGATLCLLFK